MDLAIIVAPRRLGLAASPIIKTNVPVRPNRGPVLRRYSAARPMPGPGIEARGYSAARMSMERWTIARYGAAARSAAMRARISAKRLVPCRALHRA